MPRIVLIAAMFLTSATLHAQVIGTVPEAGVQVTGQTAGPLPVANGRITLTGNPTVTAGVRSAEIKLTRGGSLRLCQSTPVHFTQLPGEALLVALDRGGVELHTKATPADVLLTPDLRFTPLAAGTLELEIRVSRNGDTCVDNRGRHAPPLNIVDAFGQTTYQLKPGQHVLFEHGSLREVMDRETLPCGCPPDEPVTIPLAEAALRGGADAPKVTPAQAAAANPFPAAVSEGLAPPTPLPPETPGVTHVQVTSTLRYDPSKPDPDTQVPAVAALPPPSEATGPAPTQKSGPLTAIGHFFKRIFVR